MSRLSFACAFAGALMLAGPAAAQKNVAKDAMKATAPMKMTPPGEGDVMRQCDKLAVDQHIKMEDHARFVKDCIAKKMAAEKSK